MPLVRIGEVGPDKRIRFGLAQKIGGDVKSSFQRIGSSVGTKAQTSIQTGLKKLEGRFQEGLKAPLEFIQDPGAVFAPGEQPAEGEASNAEMPDPSGLPNPDQLEGYADYAGALMECGRVHEARAIVGALDTILKVTRTASMEIQAAPRNTQAAPTPAPPVNPADEGPIGVDIGTEAASPEVPLNSGFVEVGRISNARGPQNPANAYVRNPGVLNPPLSTEPIFGEPTGMGRRMLTPAFGPDAGLVVLPRSSSAPRRVMVVPEIARHPDGIVFVRPRRSVPPFSWRKGRG